MPTRPGRRLIPWIGNVSIAAVDPRERRAMPTMLANPTLPAVLLLALALAALPAVAAREGDPLRPIVDCVAQDAPASLSLTRLPEAVRSRSVETAGGARPVSLNDGYRLLLSDSSGEPSLNLKIEQSIVGQWDADIAVLRQQMAMFVRRMPSAEPLFSEGKHEGVEWMSLRRPALATRGPMAIATLIHRPTRVVASAYFLKSQSYEMQLQQLADCLARPSAHP